jgi:hypothetical protein
VSIPALGKNLWIDNINVQRNSNELIIFTPQYDDNTRTDNSGTEVLVEMSRPSLILPSPAYARGIVRGIRKNAGSTNIPFDHVVLSAHGTKADKFANLSIGDEIRISQEVTHYQQNCSTSNSNDWTKTYASIGGSFVFLKDNQIIHYNDLGALQQHPRTAIAYNDDYIFFIVVDGRDPPNSIGMTIDELALFSRDTLGATWGINQDGGGSSTMVINGVVVNRPNANLYEQKIYIPFIISNGYEDPAPPDNFLEEAFSTDVLVETSAVPSNLEPVAGGGFERYVANGMLMVVVEPMEKSVTFSPNDLIITHEVADIRLGPGSNYEILTTVSGNTGGIILNHSNGLNGALAKGSYWWKVLIAGVEGWVKEGSIEPFTP